MNMCGEIDEEITIPELVKEGSLCPHQDYVYFNYPTTAETKEIQNFEERSSQMLQSLMQVIQTVETELISVLVENMRERDAGIEQSGDAHLKNGPQIDTSVAGIVASQEQVDDLLESLGF